MPVVYLRGSVLLPFKGKNVDVRFSRYPPAVDSYEPGLYQFGHITPERFIGKSVSPRRGICKLKLTFTRTLYSHADVRHLSAGRKLLERLGEKKRISNKREDRLFAIAVCAQPGPDITVFRRFVPRHLKSPPGLP